jgi:hypothetical protein
MLHQLLQRWSNQGASGTDKRGDKCTQNVSENQKGRYHTEDLDVDSKTSSEWILEKDGGIV